MLSGHGFARNIRATSSGSWQAGISQLRTQQAAAVAAVVRSPFARGARFHHQSKHTTSAWPSGGPIGLRLRSAAGIARSPRAQ